MLRHSTKPICFHFHYMKVYNGLKACCKLS